MATPLQIGDIVRINEPTEEELEILLTQGGEIACDYVDELAVVTDIEYQDNPLVSLILCDDAFALTVDGISELQYQNEITGVMSQLTLVREGQMRSCVVSEELPYPLGGSRIPFVDSIVGAYFTIYDSYGRKTVHAGAFVDRIGLRRKGLFIDFIDGGHWIRVTNITADRIQPPGANLFTTF